MSDTDQLFIDSHVHLDHIFEENPGRIEWLKTRSFLVVSWAYSQHIKSIQELEKYLQHQAETIRKLNSKGLRCHFLTGVHPRNIPPDLQVLDVEPLLAPYLDDPLCLGIGEIGLETGRRSEKLIFAEQLALGSKYKAKGMRIGVHTPRENKAEITLQIISILNSYSGLEDITVIDHCTPQTIAWVLKKHYWAGITLSPSKSGFNDLKKIIDRYPEYQDRIMCNTDSGSDFYEDLNTFINDSSFPENVRNRFARENAAAFFNLTVKK